LRNAVPRVLIEPAPRGEPALSRGDRGRFQRQHRADSVKTGEKPEIPILSQPAKNRSLPAK
jgi:hypothetical protein